MIYTGDKTDVTALVKYAQGLEVENERLLAALRPFAEVARGHRLNPTPDEWQHASALVAAE